MIYGTFKCINCGKEVQRINSKQKRCPECQAVYRKARTKERQRARRLLNKMIDMLEKGREE